jgi:hypothetical protein
MQMPQLVGIARHIDRGDSSHHRCRSPLEHCAKQVGRLLGHLLIELDLAVGREPLLMSKQRDQRIDEDPHLGS